jgi:hypothetical protein
VVYVAGSGEPLIRFRGRYLPARVSSGPGLAR